MNYKMLNNIIIEHYLCMCDEDMLSEISARMFSSLKFLGLVLLPI